jgi:hypothetical protein
MKRLKAILILIFALIAASAARAQSTSGVNDAELNGNYVFTFVGFTGSGGSFTVFAAVGRFTADGAGNVTSGVLDSNGVSAASVLTAQPFTGTYTIGADNRGTLTLSVAGATATFAFAMMANGNAELIRFDAAGGTGTIGSGTIEKADSAAFSIAQITGDYAFALAGLDASGGRVAFAGRLTSSGTGNFSNEAGDINAHGSFGSAIFTSAIYTVTDTTLGRGTMSWTFTFDGTSFTLNFVFYIVNSGKLFVMETDSLAGGSFPLLNGPMVQQQTPTGGFSNGSLNGGTVISLTGRQVCGGAANPDVIAGLITWNGSGSLTLPFDENCGGVFNSSTGFSGTYTVAPNGRVAIALGTMPEIAYLTGPNQIFFLASGPESFLGPGDAQAAGAFNNGSVTGNYAGFATTPQTPSVTIFSGEFGADGASPTGNLTGTVDIGNASGPTSGAAFAATYSISSSPTNGRGSVTITSPAGVNGIAYVISPTEFVMLPSSVAGPSLWHFEQAPSTAPPPTMTLTSITLNPTTVVGGQSSTGTVTLSGAAPSGGAQVMLSSGNTAVAQVPPSVTVQAGQTTATFTVTTNAVTASTAVTISATFGGVTQTASLTVTPPPPPTITLISLTLNPTTVVGGQSSTGTVTLSGAAPSGDAQVMLSSSNTAVVQVPSSVTVQAGQTTATFTVTTNAVTASTAVTISATFGGVTQTASLTVTPPPLPTLISLTLNPTTVVGGQSSTGTVTLSGPAPSGGAQVMLSSSNTTVAQVPSSVTVQSGQTTATFTVTTSAVTASTPVTISATLGGVTRTSSLTVTPPPLPTLISLTLNPSSVTGGPLVGTSTGTVALSGPAPSGGAQITLSSSNPGVASLPSSVTIAAGSASSTFTVSTSLVLSSTNVTISASYNGTTKQATLTVNPVLQPPPLPPL